MKGKNVFTEDEDLRLESLIEQKQGKSKSEQTKITDRKLWEYSQQLSMLATLLQRKMITQAEYDKIKRRLMRDYKITSDILT